MNKLNFGRKFAISIRQLSNKFFPPKKTNLHCEGWFLSLNRTNKRVITFVYCGKVRLTISTTITTTIEKYRQQIVDILKINAYHTTKGIIRKSLSRQ